MLTSKLIDGTFPDYARVIPLGNDKELVVDKKEFEAAVDRVSTVSSERGRAVKLSITGGKLLLSVTNPDSGSANEELEVEYDVRSDRYRLQFALPARHRRADRERGRGAQARRSGLADADPGQGAERRALRADADAGLTGIRYQGSGIRAVLIPDRRFPDDPEPHAHTISATITRPRSRPARRPSCWSGRTAPARPI